MTRRILEHDIPTNPLCNTEVLLCYGQVKFSESVGHSLLLVQERTVADIKGATVEELHIYYP